QHLAGGDGGSGRARAGRTAQGAHALAVRVRRRARPGARDRPGRHEVRVRVRRRRADPDRRSADSGLLAALAGRPVRTRRAPALGWDNVSDVGVGKYLRFEVEAEGEEAARKQAEQMANRFLTNPVIEDHAILEVEPAEPATATGPDERR